jgi:hypothetical protein
MKATLELHGQFLLNSQINYICTYLADHFSPLTHDNIQYFLKSSRFTPVIFGKKLNMRLYCILMDILFSDSNGFCGGYKRHSNNQ